MSHNSDNRIPPRANPPAVAALCVSGRSIYKHLPGVVAYDRRRDARTFAGGMPVVAHPPCRLWSKFLSHQAKAENPEAEKELGRWCVRQVLKWGGVLEQPAHSALWREMGLPVPSQPADGGIFTVYIEQEWFGYATKKPTWVLIAGVPRNHLPAIPFRFHRAKSLDSMSAFARARTVTAFAEWLVETARRANPPGRGPISLGEAEVAA